MERLTLLLALLLLAACGTTTQAQVPPEMAELGDWVPVNSPVQGFTEENSPDSAEVVTLPEVQYFRIWEEGERMKVWCYADGGFFVYPDSLEAIAEQTMNGELEHGINGPLMVHAECIDDYALRRDQALNP